MQIRGDTGVGVQSPAGAHRLGHSILLLYVSAPALVVLIWGALRGTWWSWSLAAFATLWMGFFLLLVAAGYSVLRADSVSEWEKTVLYLRSVKWEAAQANAGLLEQAEPRWNGTVVARTSMADLLFTCIGDEYPFDRTVKVSFSEADETFTFTLVVGDFLVTADKAHPATAPAVLDAFLMQLSGELPAGPTPGAPRIDDAQPVGNRVTN